MLISYFDEDNLFLEYFGHVDPSSGYAIGPYWLSPRMADDEESKTNNGFLYGHLDQNGDISGEKILLVHRDNQLTGSFDPQNKRSVQIKSDQCLFLDDGVLTDLWNNKR